MASDTITDELGRPACPRSWENADLTTTFELHFADEQELSANGGVCARCAAKIKKNGKAILAGKIESPAEMTHHREPNVEQDHAAFIIPGHAEQITEFDFGAVEEALGEIEAAEPEAKQIAAELFGKIMQWTFRPPVNLRIAACRWAALCAGIRPDILGDRTATEFADELGVTKQNMSKVSTGFQHAFNVKFSRSRSAESRQRMAARRLGGPDRHHPRPPE